ncbi:hypothetical protein OZL46_22490 [Bacillus sonorensis]|uniref:hypothetical protein n=1 Tax=Bacillus sonorensis TaxID=119858 RepID=UPI002280F5E0|nr:hypothetical protein [Bacillus sonorensis]MCZ0071127.1 hypothetical protein [Bacillus sonorensis]MCZ0098643.1 hypothetical protein [Bacillus sonorensis]MEC1520362.1 hypothetical protein [Bacillus sonorensis]
MQGGTLARKGTDFYGHVNDAHQASKSKIQESIQRIETGKGVGENIHNDGKATIGTKSVQAIKKHFPDDQQLGKRFDFTIENGRIKNINGINEVDFVIDMDGNLHIGRGHSYLANGKDVQAAGKLKINGQGQIRRISNESGHYRPNADQAKKYPDAFNQTGLNVKNAWLEIHEFESNISNYIVDDKIIFNQKIK